MDWTMDIGGESLLLRETAPLRGRLRRFFGERGDLIYVGTLLRTLHGGSLVTLPLAFSTSVLGFLFPTVSYDDFVATTFLPKLLSIRSSIPAFLAQDLQTENSAVLFYGTRLVGVADSGLDAWSPWTKSRSRLLEVLFLYSMVGPCGRPVFFQAQEPAGADVVFQDFALNLGNVGWRCSASSRTLSAGPGGTLFRAAVTPLRNSIAQPGALMERDSRSSDPEVLLRKCRTIEEMFQLYDGTMDLPSQGRRDPALEEIWLFLNHLAVNIRLGLLEKFLQVGAGESPSVVEDLLQGLAGIRATLENGSWTVTPPSPETKALCEKIQVNPMDFSPLKDLAATLR